MADTGNRVCPTCGHPFVGDVWGTDYDGPTCSPLRCSAWKVIGKTTKPDALGMKRMLRVVK